MLSKIHEKINKYVVIFFQVKTQASTKMQASATSFIHIWLYICYCKGIYGKVSNTISKPLQLVQNRILRALQYKQDKYAMDPR